MTVLPVLTAPQLPSLDRNLGSVRARARQDDRVEFATFYAANIDKLTMSLQATVMDSDLAQDAAQEAMARAYQRWPDVQTYDNQVGWCYRVGLNWSRSRWRKRRREVVSDAATNCPVAVASTLVDEALTRALLDLSLPLRSVVVLRVLMDWSYDEIAEALEVPRGTVASRLHRALDCLRDNIGAQLT